MGLQASVEGGKTKLVNVMLLGDKQLCDCCYGGTEQGANESEYSCCHLDPPSLPNAEFSREQSESTGMNCYARYIDSGKIGIARGAGGASVPVVRLARLPGFLTTTAVAIAPLGLRALGSCLHQSEHPQSSSQLKTRCPLLVKYDVILLINGHHSFPRGIPLAIPIMLYFLHNDKLIERPLYSYGTQSVIRGYQMPPFFEFLSYDSGGNYLTTLIASLYARPKHCRQRSSDISLLAHLPLCSRKYRDCSGEKLSVYSS